MSLTPQMRAWVRLHSYTRNKPLNGTTVFTPLSYTKETVAFLQRSRSAPHIKSVLAGCRQDVVNSVTVQFLPEKAGDHGYMEYKLCFSQVSSNDIRMEATVEAERAELLQRRFILKRSCKLSTAPELLACETLDRLFCMLENEATLREMHTMLSDAFRADIEIYSIRSPLQFEKI